MSLFDWFCYVNIYFFNVFFKRVHLKIRGKKIALAFSRRAFHSDDPTWTTDFTMNLTEVWLKLACSCKLLIAVIELWPCISSDRDSSSTVILLVQCGFTDCRAFGVISSDPPVTRRARDNKCTGQSGAPATYQTRNLKGGIHAIRRWYYDRTLSPLH